MWDPQNLGFFGFNVVSIIGDFQTLILNHPYYLHILFCNGILNLVGFASKNLPKQDQKWISPSENAKNHRLWTSRYIIPLNILLKNMFHEYSNMKSPCWLNPQKHHHHIHNISNKIPWHVPLRSISMIYCMIYIYMSYIIWISSGYRNRHVLHCFTGTDTYNPHEIPMFHRKIHWDFFGPSPWEISPVLL